MTSNEAKEILRYRITLLRNSERIFKAAKKSEKANEDIDGQLSMFNVGLEKEAPNIELEAYKGNVHEIDLVIMEKEVIGLPITFNPLDENQIYKDLYCTHEMNNLRTMLKTKEGIVVMDYITKINHRTSQRGNHYAQIITSELEEGNFFYLFGDMYKDNIRDLFINQIYLIELTYNQPSLTFDRDSFIIDRIKNVKDVQIDKEAKRLINNLKIESELNEPWMLCNKNNIIK